MKSPHHLLAPYRARIDALDREIVDLLAARTDIIREVAALKHEHDIPAVLQERVDQVREQAAAYAATHGVDAEAVREIYARIIQYSCDLEDEIMRGLKKKSA